MGTSSNRNGIGATVTIEAGNSTQIREVSAGASYASMHSIDQQFGLSRSSLVDRATVRWPSGTVQELTNVGVNQTLVIVEPLPTAVSDGDTPRTPLVFRLSRITRIPSTPRLQSSFSPPKPGRCRW